MYRRYQFLPKDYVLNAINKLRAAFLAAKNGEDVEDIIKGILTYDERLKVGRRIEIAQMLEDGITYKEIADELKVGLSTISLVDKLMRQYPKCYELIKEREEKVEREFKNKAYVRKGGPKMIYKSRHYTGFKRKDVAR